MFYEIIYETGRNSIANYNDDDEARAAVGEHHRRAIHGELAQMSNEQMGPAERVVKVLKYNEHPADYGASQAVSIDEVRAAVDEALDKHAVGDMVSVPEVAASIRDITRPTVESGPHESNYKMSEVAELTGWENA